MATINNKITFTLSNGVAVEYPAIAAAFGYCMLKFTSSSTHAYEVRLVKCGDYTVRVVLDANGAAAVSLFPFIAATQAAMIQAMPTVTNYTAPSHTSKFYGSLTFTISGPGVATVEVTKTLYFIYGSNALEADTARHVSVNDDTIFGTWVTMLYADSIDSGGVPKDIDTFTDVNINMAEDWIGASTSTNEIVQLVGDKIITDNVTYVLHYDCRVNGVRGVRWIDSRGGVNIRKLTLASEQQAVERSGEYARPRDENVAKNGYNPGADLWNAETETARIVTLGDEAIPVELYDWLKELATSPCVDLYDGGLWQRCNVQECTLSRDRQKSVFTMTLQLRVPSYNVQQF